MRVGGERGEEKEGERREREKHGNTRKHFYYFFFHFGRNFCTTSEALRDRGGDSRASAALLKAASIPSRDCRISSASNGTAPGVVVGVAPHTRGNVGLDLGDSVGVKSCPRDSRIRCSSKESSGAFVGVNASSGGGGGQSSSSSSSSNRFSVTCGRGGKGEYLLGRFLTVGGGGLGSGLGRRTTGSSRVGGLGLELELVPVRRLAPVG